jgi:RNA polymerase sigma factor (sigma-70 family)
MTSAGQEEVWRRCAPLVLAALVRRYGDFDAAEDAVQEALLAAARQWPTDGMPDNPRGWLITVASRRLADQWRAEQARTDREQLIARHTPPEAFLAPAAGTLVGGERDDSLTLLLLCCHPALTRPSQVALTLRAVAGLSTAQIARAFLVPEATMAQRISRAKTRLRQVGARFTVPAAEQLPDRVAAVAKVDGPAAALAMLEPLLQDRQLRRHHRLHAVHAHLLEMDGRVEEARAAYATAARLAASIPEQRYLNTKAAQRAPV